MYEISKRELDRWAVQPLGEIELGMFTWLRVVHYNVARACRLLDYMLSKTPHNQFVGFPEKGIHSSAVLAKALG